MPAEPLPFVLSIPHAGLDVPPEIVDRIALDDVAIYNECDLWADQLFDFATAGLEQSSADQPARGALAVVQTPIARALVDVNRPPDTLDDPDGPVKTQTSYGVQIYSNLPAIDERAALRDKYWGAYHRRIDAALHASAPKVRLLLDCHNMAQMGPSHYAYAGLPRPLLCLANLGGPDGASVEGAPTTCPGWFLRHAGALAAELFGGMTLLEPSGDPPPVVALNYPFGGGYIIKRYSNANPDASDRASRAPLAMMIEVNRGLFVGNQTPRSPVLPPNAERIVALRDALYRWALALSAMIEDSH